MRRKAGILLCSVFIGLSAAGCMVLPEIFEEGAAERAVLSEPVKTMAWWSLTYEMPNPEKLPVQVRFQWLKGLE